MCEFCVRTISDSFPVSEEEKTLMSEIPHEDNLNNRFPFSDEDNSGCEVFFKGSKRACDVYLNDLPSRIQHFFVVGEVDSSARKLI